MSRFSGLLRDASMKLCSHYHLQKESQRVANIAVAALGSPHISDVK
jgi:hypothetical protein